MHVRSVECGVDREETSEVRGNGVKGVLKRKPEPERCEGMGGSQRGSRGMCTFARAKAGVDKFESVAE